MDALADADGFLRPDARPVGLPWQEPDTGGLDAGGTGSGRTDLHDTIDTTGRTTDRRSDFDDVYGNWQSLRDQLAAQDAARVAAAGTARSRRRGRRPPHRATSADRPLRARRARRGSR